MTRTAMSSVIRSTSLSLMSTAASSTTIEAVTAYLPATADLTPRSGVLLWPPANLLLLTGVLNDAGGADVAPAAIQAALASFGGPIPLATGPADCTVRPQTIFFPEGACSTLVEVAERTGDLLEHLPPVDLDR